MGQRAISWFGVGRHKTCSGLRSRNFSKPSPRLWQIAKHAAETKEWHAQRVERLWFDTQPKAPSAAAWSAHSFPSFSAWQETWCIVIRSLSELTVGRSLSCTCVRAKIDCAPPQTGSMLGIVENTGARITGNRAVGPKKRERLNSGLHLGSSVGMDPGTCECKMSFGRDNWAKHWHLFSLHPHPAKVSPSAKRVPPVSVEGPAPEHHCLLRALEYEHWWDADIWLWQPPDEISDLGSQEYVSSGKLTDTRGHRPEWYAILKVPRIITISAVVFFRKRFWTTTSSGRTTLYFLQQFKEFGILFSSIETWYCRNYVETMEGN